MFAWCSRLVRGWMESNIMTELPQRVQGGKKRGKAGVAPACLPAIPSRPRELRRGCLSGLAVPLVLCLLRLLVERGAPGLGIERTVLVVLPCIDFLGRLFNAGNAFRV